MTTALIYDPIFLEHITPSQHLERPQRLESAMQVLEALGWLERDGLVQLPPRAASEDELALIHERDYIRRVKEAAEKAAEAHAKGGKYPTSLPLIPTSRPNPMQRPLKPPGRL